MRNVIPILLTLTLALAASASASGWYIAASHPAPAPNARGYCPGAPFPLSVLCDGSPPRIYYDGYPSNYISLDVPSGVWGLARWIANGITVSNYANSYIYHLTTTGSVISSFRCPKDHPADISTAPWDNYVAIPEENLALELTTNGSIISSFRGPGAGFRAIQARNPSQYICGDAITHKVYFAGYGSIAFDAPSAIYADISTGDGPIIEHFTVVDSATNYIYGVIWVGPEPVEPVSLGRVRALFK